MKVSRNDLEYCTQFPSVYELTYKHVSFNQPFAVYSEIIKGWFFFPIGFVDDHESVPGFKGTSLIGGHTHDLACREDVMDYIIFDDPKTAVKEITKELAADIYLDIMKRRYKMKLDGKKGIKKQAKRLELWARRYGKYWVVRLAWGYFHKFKVMATYEEITA